MLRTSFFRSATMVEAIGILSTLQVISQGLVPLVDATGEPYGISRDVVKGAVRAGSALNPPRTGRDESDRPMPALSQVTATPAPNIAINSSESGGGKDLATLGLESVPCTSPLNNRQGYLRYEKIPEQRLVDGTNSKPLDNIRQTKNPVDVLVYCLSKCSNRSGQGFSACKSVNFGPGQEGTSYSGRPPIYSESKCMIAGSTENLRYMPHPTHAEYRTICLSSTGDDEKPKPRSETECPKRLYVIESHWNHQFVLNSSVQFPASTEQKCQELCLNQDGLKQPGQSKFICRSGSFDNVRKKCYLSSLTRRNEKNFFRKVNSKEDVNYFENTCLGAETRCPLSKLIYIKEEGMELDVPYSLSYRNISLDECKMKCTSSKIIFCRSLVYDEKESVCKLSDDDAYTKNTKIAQKGVSYYQLNCNDGLNIKPTTDPNSDSETQPLNQRNYRMVKTAFQLHRRKALVSSLSSNFRNVERDRLTRVTLAECLDACLMEKKYTCRSVMYSDRTDTCKLSDHDTVTGRLVDDRDYDYYKNLMQYDDGADDYNEKGREGDFVIMEKGKRLRMQHIKKDVSADSLEDCMDICARQTTFRCTAFNYRYVTSRFDTSCELTNMDIRKLEDMLERGSQLSYIDVDTDPTYDIYMRRVRSGDSWGGSNKPWDDSSNSWGNSGSSPWGNSGGGNSWGSSGSDGLGSAWNLGSNWGSSGSSSSWGNDNSINDIYVGEGREEVSQRCLDDGSMEFRLKTEGPFRGRIYTYGHYETCSTRGTGASTTFLKIQPDRRCGVDKYRDTTTAIVVIQFSEALMTMRDKRYNLTCTVLGPLESTVTSGSIGSGSGVPVPIEYIPAENRLESNVRLEILYNNRPTTTIAVGDPLTFRIVSRAGRNFASDIFATNVKAFDPYTGKEVSLIDRMGCPIDTTVFSSLSQSRDGSSLQTEFSGFKIPESAMIVFQADIRPCRNRCSPAKCTVGNGRDTLPSWGRRRRSATGDEEKEISKLTTEKIENKENVEENVEENDLPTENIHGVYDVYMSRDEIPQSALVSALPHADTCLPSSTYYSLMIGLITLVFGTLAGMTISTIYYRKYRKIASKNTNADFGNPNYRTSEVTGNRLNFPGPHPRTVPQPARYFPSHEGSVGGVDCEGGIIAPRTKSKSSRPVYKDPSEPIYTDPNLFEK